MTREGRRGLGHVSASVVGQSLNAAVAMAAAVVLPRVLGPDDYGIFAAVMAIVSVFAVLSTLGLPLAEVRFLPPLRQSGDEAAFSELASTIWSVRMVVAVLAAVICGVWIRGSSFGVGGVISAWAAGLALARFVFLSSRSLLLPLDRPGWFFGLEVVQTLTFLAAFLAGYLVSGLESGFVLATAVGLVLSILTVGLLRSQVTVTFGRARWSRLSPLLGFSVFSFAGNLASAIRVGMPVWMVAEWSGSGQAAFIGVAMQVFVLVTSFLFGARQSVLPILAEMEEAGDRERTLLWVEWMTRVWVAVFSAGIVVWALVGRDIVRLVLGEDFTPAFYPILWVLVGALATVVGAMANGLLYLRKRALAGAVNLLVAALLTLTGTAFALAGPQDSTALWAAISFAAASVVFAVLANVSLFALEGDHLSIGRLLVLSAPVVLSVAALRWEAELLARVVVAAAFLGIYAFGAIALGLIDLKDFRYVLRLARPGGSR